MNNVQLVGRFVRDPEVRYTDGGLSIVRFHLAVDRVFKSENGPSADFISCTAFGKTAEFVEKYFSKGQKIGLVGRIQTGSYENKEGATIYTTDVVAERVEFVESRDRETRNTGTISLNDTDGFMNIPDGDEELPFN